MEKYVIQKVFDFDQLKPEVKSMLVDNQRETYYNHEYQDQWEYRVDDFIEERIPKYMELERDDIDMDGTRVTFRINVHLKKFILEHRDKLGHELFSELFETYDAGARIKKYEKKTPPRFWYVNSPSLLMAEIGNAFDATIRYKYARGVEDLEELELPDIEETDINYVPKDTSGGEDEIAIYLDELTGSVVELITEMYDELFSLIEKDIELIASELEAITDEIENPDDEYFLEELRDREYFENGDLAEDNLVYFDMPGAKELKIIRSISEPAHRNRNINEFMGGE